MLVQYHIKPWPLVVSYRLVAVWNPLASPVGLVMDLIPMYDYIASFIDKLENTGFLIFADLPNVDAVHYTISKNANW